MIRILLTVALALMLSGPAVAVEPTEMLDDPALEARARELSKEIRCLVCQNQSIDDSNAGLAKDLRVLLRERLVAGDSDSEIKDFMVERYGDFVLLKPQVKATTYALWYGPLAVGVIGAFAVFIFLMRRRKEDETGAAAPPLTDEERRRVESLLAEQDRNG